MSQEPSADRTGRLADDGLPPLGEVIATHGLSAKKSLGQNFLLDLNLTRRIARAAGPLEGATVIEIGPGPGGLTRALLAEGAARVVAVERDPRCLTALAQIAAHYPDRLTVLEGDALEIDPLGSLEGPVRIAANLPYNIGTVLLTRWLSAPIWPPRWQSLTLMFQREVAERIVAGPGTSAYGRLAVLAQWRAEARLLFEVGPKAFTPPPKVTSAVVRITPTAARRAVDPAALARVTAAAFGQRRKMLRQSLKPLGEPLRMLEAAGIDPTRRAETLSIDEFLALAAGTRKIDTGTSDARKSDAG
ncbi:MAG: 16S rRNA (adenine(1518)-N(6)/adenine(1519)-N(6))-dimethyltransferase RsmA [Pseudomonadota bacterium]